MTTKNIEDVMAEFNRQLKLGIKVGEKNPEISAFIGAWDKYDDEANDCPLTSQDRKVIRELLTQLVKEVEAGERERIAQWAKQQRRTRYVYDFTEEAIVYEDLIEVLTPPTSDINSEGNSK